MEPGGRCSSINARRHDSTPPSASGGRFYRKRGVAGSPAARLTCFAQIGYGASPGLGAGVRQVKKPQEQLKEKTRGAPGVVPLAVKRVLSP